MKIRDGDTKSCKIAVVAMLALCAWSGAAWTQDSQGESSAESTIRLMGAAEAEVPGAVTKEISLPESVSEDSAAVENAARGLETAKDNRLRREQGLTTADDARQRGAAEAAENRENLGRSEDRPEKPEGPNPPNPPGPPGG